jgi:hypothetical protein
MSVCDGLAKVLDVALSPLGFRRRATNWYRRGDEIYSIVNIQKSRFDDSCYLNIAFCPTELMVDDWTSESRCPIRFRVDALTTISAADAALLDARTAQQMNEYVWQLDVADRIGARVAQVMKSIGSLDDLRGFLQSNRPERVFIGRDVKDLLHIS